LFQFSNRSSLKPCLCSKKISNLKIWALGMEVEIEITRGLWSEVSLTRALQEVFGKARVQEAFMNT